MLQSKFSNHHQRVELAADEPHGGLKLRLIGVIFADNIATSNVLQFWITILSEILRNCDTLVPKKIKFSAKVAT